MRRGDGNEVGDDGMRRGKMEQGGWNYEMKDGMRRERML